MKVEVYVVCNTKVVGIFLNRKLLKSGYGKIENYENITEARIRVNEFLEIKGIYLNEDLYVNRIYGVRKLKKNIVKGEQN